MSTGLYVGIMVSLEDYRLKPPNEDLGGGGGEHS